jgi:hypothetical protein
MEGFDTDKFICTIQNCSELWNTCAREHAEKSKRETAWRMVLTVMCGEEEIKKWEVDRCSEMSKFCLKIY